MSPQDKVERVLKEIHVAFSNSPTYNRMPDKMIVDRKEFLDLLDRLNRGIYDMMEQYELTRQGRQNAERRLRKMGNDIIEKANEDASDIYAASMLYTADTIGRIRSLMDQTNDSMNDLFRQFKRQLKEEKDLLRTHESELHAQLMDLSDTKKYLSMLEEINREHERQTRDLEAERNAGRRYARDMFGLAGQEKKEETDGAAARTERKTSAADKPEVKINTDSPYFKWKEQQKEGEEKTEAEQEEALAKQVTEELLKESVPEEAPVEKEPESNAFPNEEAIRKAVLEDERAMEFDRYEDFKERSGAAGILKNIIFGKD